MKIKSFECPESKSVPTVLFPIYQNNTWTIRHLVNETIDPEKLNSTFFPYRPELPKRPKQNNSCSKMWPIEYRPTGK